MKVENKINYKRVSVAFVVSIALSITSMASANPATGDWPISSHDYNNTNNNSDEKKINSITAKYLRRTWETFNDDSLVFEPTPTGFVLESVLGLSYPKSVVGVLSSPIIIDGTVYYIDQLGTIFARDAETGEIQDSNKHWTTTLVDPVFDLSEAPVLPGLFFSAPVVTDDYIWIASSSSGRLHAIQRNGGAEVDFDLSDAAITPYELLPEFPFSSVLGDAVVVNTGPEDGNRDLFILGINVILNDALIEGGEAGVQLAIDITNPLNPVEAWRRASVDVNPATSLRYGSGSSLSSGLAVDLERKVIYGGTGQQTSLPYVGYPDPTLAPTGFIDRSDSMYAIDYITGSFLWVNQFHNGDVFELNAPISTGPNNPNPNGAVDADVIAPPVLWTAKINGVNRDLVGTGSKGGLYRVVDRETGETVWERNISKQTGIGGIQGGSAYADGTVYVVGYEGLDDGFSDAQFGVSFDTGNNPNAFFATFNPSFWADVEDVSEDNDPSTGMRTKLYALNAKTGQSKWSFANGNDFVELKAGAALRHVSVANGVIFVTTSSGQLFAIDQNGEILFNDQTPDLNDLFSLGLGKPQHASMNAGTVISNGMIFVGYGGQNNPSGGILAYEIDGIPASLELLSLLNQKSWDIPMQGPQNKQNKFRNKLERAITKAINKVQANKIQKAIAKLKTFKNITFNAVDAGVLKRKNAKALRVDANVIISILRDEI